MKRIILAGLLILLLIVASCSTAGVSKEKYDTAIANLATASAQVQSLQKELGNLQGGSYTAILEAQIQSLQDQINYLKSLH